ncbi:MAG: hypothetical protein Q7U60_09400 [Candidatus Methanoperedens sp.]|nr:hypothetical protein [Candidatus Methanoperedens sp.]
MKRSLDKNHPSIASFSKTPALLRKTNREAEAQEMEERARAIRGGRKGD